MNEIYFVESQYLPNSASVNRLFAFALYLKKKGVKPHFYYLFPDRYRSKSQRYTEEFEFHYLWEGIIPNNKYLCTIVSLLKLRKCLKAEVPVYVYSLINCLYFLKKKHIKLYHECTENPNASGRVNNFVGKFLFSLYKKAVRECEALFVITPSLKQYYIDTTHINPQKVEVLNMIVDPQRFEKIYNVKVKDWISYCGTISEKKDGISYLIKSFAQIASKYPTYTLHIIGDYENDNTKCNVLHLIDKLQLKNRITLTGPVSPDKIPLLLAESRILALARPRQKEKAFGFATKIGEYLMTERPVVMTDVGNVKDYLEDGESVILSKPNDENDFAKKLAWAIENEVECYRIGKKGKQCALRFFNAEIEGEKIYKRIYVNPI